MFVYFACSSGHKVKAESRFGGHQAACPICHERLVVPNRSRNPITDSAVVRMLDECHAEPKATQTRQTHVELPAPKKICPRCEHTLIRSARVCPYCRLYLVPSADTWRSALQAAKCYVNAHAHRRAGV